MTPPRFRRAYADDEHLYGQVFELLELAFPGAGLRAQAQAARVLGLRWEEITTPFVSFQDAVLVSHVGVLDLPMVLDGRETHVGGIHAVSTHPAFRRRGFYRAVMEEALHWCDARYDTLELTTAQPELYEPFGFRVVPEYRFVGCCTASGLGGALRCLNFTRPDDVALLHRLLDQRTPVSHRVAVVREQQVFIFNEVHRPLHYAADLDAIISFELHGATLQLFDLVGTAIPPLAEVVARIPSHVKRVAVYFAPDRLDASLEPQPFVLNGDDRFMVRGPFPDKGKPFMVPRSARH